MNICNIQKSLLQSMPASLLQSSTAPVKRSPSCPPPVCKVEVEEGLVARWNSRKVVDTAGHADQTVNKQEHPWSHDQSEGLKF